MTSSIDPTRDKESTISLKPFQATCSDYTRLIIDSSTETNLLDLDNQLGRIEELLSDFLVKSKITPRNVTE